MQIDANRVIEKLSQKLAEATATIAVLEIQIELLTEENEKTKEQMVNLAVEPSSNGKTPLVDVDSVKSTSME